MCQTNKLLNLERMFGQRNSIETAVFVVEMCIIEASWESFREASVHIESRERERAYLTFSSLQQQLDSIKAF